MSDGSPTGAILQEDEESSEEQWQPNHRQSERKTRFPRACTTRPSARFGHDETSSSPAKQRRHGGPVSGGRREKQEKEEFCGGGGGSGGSSSRVITPLVEQPESPAQLTRWSLRSMWELASLLDFLHVFRPLLNISAEFSAEELETALITPNSTLGDIHIPILKAIPPVTRMALGPATWVTVLCRKLRDWWHWVADGELPIVASHGTEIETYKMLEPATRVLILKALCDIRVEQEDIRSYIDNSLKHGIQLSAFRKERIGGDSYGVSYWFEDDPIIGNRLYREIRQIEVKRMKGKGMPAIPLISCQWETVATNLDEFQEVSERLFSSTNRTEVSLGKKLKIDILPDVEKIHKKKERTLKKQHRQALLLDSFLATDGLSSGRSLRDRKPVTYTFDDFDRSINEAIKITKRRQSSPEEQTTRKEGVPKPETSSNGNKSNGPEHNPQEFYYDNPSPKFSEYEESDGEQKPGALDRSNRRRKRSQRYSDKDYVEAISENDADFDSDDDIVGEVVYDEEYLRRRKQRKISSSSDGDEEYSWEGENAEEEEDEAEDSLSMSEASDESPRLKKIPTRSRCGSKSKSVGDVQTGPRRSRRSTRPRIDYRQYELSDSEAGSTKSEKSNASDRHSDASNEPETSMPSQDSREENGVVMKDSNPNQEIATHVEEEPKHNQIMEDNNPSQEDDGSRHRRFLDLNELAPGTGFDDGPGSSVQGEDGTNNF